LNSQQRNSVKKNTQHHQFKKTLLTTGITTLTVSGALLASPLKSQADETQETTTSQISSSEKTTASDIKNSESNLHNTNKQTSRSSSEKAESHDTISQPEDTESEQPDNDQANVTDAATEVEENGTVASSEKEQETSSANNSVEQSANSEAAETESTENDVVENSTEKENSTSITANKAENEPQNENDQNKNKDSKQTNTTKSQNNKKDVKPRIASLTKTLSPDRFNIGDKRYTTGDAVDVSSFQSWMNQSDFNYLKKIGIKTIIVKTTEGNVYTNPYAQNQIRMAKKAGLNVSVYHFVRFSDKNGARGEGQYTASAMKKMNLGKSTLIFADIEAPETMRNNINMKAVLNEFWSALKKQGYTNHGVYIGPYHQYFNQAVSTVGKNRTWIAQYPYTPIKNGTYENQWKNAGYGGWQFSSTAMLRGNFLDVSHSFNNLLKKPNSLYKKQHNGSVNINGYWYFYKNGNMQTGFVKNNNQTFYYNSKGQRLAGNRQINGYHYFFDKKTGAMRTGFVNFNGNKFYFNSNGHRLGGERYIGGFHYFFDKKTGAMRTGFVNFNGKTYYFNSKGQRLGGNRIINGTKYSFDKTTGALIS